ncbi:uncharacterized protein LOC141649694 [Silene latifolia]|uniref:uncharacterized protein LOC141649694 n=1 Tax=Silene latifolia TaxID=37657 RepID=UPI003D784FD9
MKAIEEEMNIPITSEEIESVNLLNSEQKYAYSIIYDRVVRNKCGAFFLDGPGGTGKTFLYSALLANLRSHGIIALAVASSGIAASNISGGKTANSRFKIPLDLDENQSYQISKQTALAFGGKVVVFGGDFRQVLPVIPKSTLQEAVSASFVTSSLWQTHKKMHLTVNMRAIHDPVFSNFVLQVGEGRPPYENGKYIRLPRAIVISESQSCSLLDTLIQSIYPDIGLTTLDPMLTTKRAILTPKNEDTEIINSF